MKELHLSKSNYDALIELAHNQSYDDIMSTTMFLRESILHYFSRLLMDTSEESPIECNIMIETADSQGISDSVKPHIVGMYQDKTEGFIYLKFEGDNLWYAIEYFPIDGQIDILMAVEKANLEL